ncbi:hypothetical protein JK358_32695 [Nocardia sp. 2]|uniref:DUF5753 domain-containing protein n=1 Tax=Nocardia acididurans TaxID=2802282 RepID=A0ABS1MFY7_9NOCA|nr:Scr1 family TA system antitoxin-like transcriptional regulator [Nocardia acididurans]MBL1079174.1 hypothetical protein [Nocardia acididurans]
MRSGRSTRNPGERPKKKVVWAWTMLLLMVSLMVPTKYDAVKTRLTGERVTAYVDRCWYQDAGRGSGWRCTGDWTLRDGSTAWGKLWGLEDRTPSVVRTVVGDNTTMAAQCRHLADMSTRDNVEVRVLPFRAGLPLGAAVPPCTIMDFGSGTRGRQAPEPAQVYCEGFSGSAYFEAEADVLAFRQAFETLTQASLGARASRDLVRELAKGYESER